MIERASVVRLAPMARLRFDRHAGKQMLLSPERGIVLSDSAAAIVELCREAREVGEIVEELVVKHGESHRDAIGRDVLDLLRDLARRGLVLEVES